MLFRGSSDDRASWQAKQGKERRLQHRHPRMGDEGDPHHLEQPHARHAFDVLAFEDVRSDGADRRKGEHVPITEIARFAEDEITGAVALIAVLHESETGYAPVYAIMTGFALLVAASAAVYAIMTARAPALGIAE